MEYAAFGRALHNRRKAFLFELGNPQKVLVLGDGDGRFLEAFAAQYQRARIDSVDLSAKMIDLAKRRVPNATFHVADARQFAFAQEYDLAVSHFFFDCFEQQELAALLARIRTKSWLVSEFRYTWWSCPFIRILYFLFRLTTGLTVTRLPDHRSTLKNLGYQVKKEQTGLGGCLASEMWILNENRAKP